MSRPEDVRYGGDRTPATRSLPAPARGAGGSTGAGSRGPTPQKFGAPLCSMNSASASQLRRRAYRMRWPGWKNRLASSGRSEGGTRSLSNLSAGAPPSNGRLQPKQNVPVGATAACLASIALSDEPTGLQICFPARRPVPGGDPRRDTASPGRDPTIPPWVPNGYGSWTGHRSRMSHPGIGGRGRER